MTRPQHERRLDALAAQTFENAQRTRGLAAHRRFAELQHVEARAVGDGVEHRFRRHGAGRQQQRELLDFLMRGEQIAFDALGQQRRCGRVGLQLVPASRSRIQAGSRGSSIGQICTTTPCFSIALTQREFCVRAVHLAGDDQHEIVGRGCVREFDDGVAALLARRRDWSCGSR